MILLATVISPSINGTSKTKIEIEILVDASIEREAKTIPADVAPNPHIIFEGFQVNGSIPKAAPAVIMAILELLISKSVRLVNLRDSNAITIPVIVIIPEYCPSTPLDQESKLITHKIQIPVKIYGSGLSIELKIEN